MTDDAIDRALDPALPEILIPPLATNKTLW